MTLKRLVSMKSGRSGHSRFWMVTRGNYLSEDQDNRTIPLTDRFTDFLKGYLASREKGQYVLAPEKTVRRKASTAMIPASGSAVTLPGAKSTPASMICAVPSDQIGPVLAPRFTRSPVGSATRLKSSSEATVIWLRRITRSIRAYDHFPCHDPAGR
jgi:hypothetical protein